VGRERNLSKSADVVVIGAGVIGCSIAYYLAKLGIRVTVLERRERICSGASGANGGGVPLSLTSPDSPTLGLRKPSIKIYQTLSEEIDCDFEYEKTGVITCAIDDAQYSLLRKHREGMTRKGIEVQLIDGDEARRQEPALGPDIIAGLEDKETGTLNPFKLTFGFARAAKRLGAEFLFCAEPKAIEMKNNKVESVVTDEDRIKADFVVNAAGAWAPVIGKMVGLTIPIQPNKGQTLVTEPVALNKRWRYVMDADYLARGASAPPDAQDIDVRLGITGGWIQEKTGNWTLGTSHEINFDAAATIDTVSRMAKRAIRFLPGLKNVKCIRMFAGFRPHCYADDLPIISKVDNLSGFIIAAGHLGGGITFAPLTGILVSELITGKETSMPIEALAFSRFDHITEGAKQ